MRIAIIGAGLAGLSAAKKLSDKADVSVFEKSRGVSGRMSTRRGDDCAFDHGAQYFTIKSSAFRHFLDPYLAAGIVAPWGAEIVTIKSDGHIDPYHHDHEIYVAAPHMNSLGKVISEGLDVRRDTHILRIVKVDDAWMLEDQGGHMHGPFDWVISSAPAPQSAALMPETFSHHASLSKVVMQGCFTLMVGLEAKPEIHWQGAFFEASPIGWMAFDSSKPQRQGMNCLVIQSTNEWAEAHIEHDRDDVSSLLLIEASKRTGLVVDKPLYQSLHRWRFANVTRGAGEAFYLDKSARLGACGDWCLKGRVEAAFESGNQLAMRLIEDGF